MGDAVLQADNVVARGCGAASEDIRPAFLERSIGAAPIVFPAGHCQVVRFVPLQQNRSIAGRRRETLRRCRSGQRNRRDFFRLQAGAAAIPGPYAEAVGRSVVEAAYPVTPGGCAAARNAGPLAISGFRSVAVLPEGDGGIVQSCPLQQDCPVARRCRETPGFSGDRRQGRRRLDGFRASAVAGCGA